VGVELDSEESSRPWITLRAIVADRTRRNITVVER
jgi:hypothetical protein